MALIPGVDMVSIQEMTELKVDSVLHHSLCDAITDFFAVQANQRVAELLSLIIQPSLQSSKEVRYKLRTQKHKDIWMFWLSSFFFGRMILIDTDEYIELGSYLRLMILDSIRDHDLKVLLDKSSNDFETCVAMLLRTQALGRTKNEILGFLGSFQLNGRWKTLETAISYLHWSFVFPRKPKKVQRKRGYNDKGNLAPSDRLKPEECPDYLSPEEVEEHKSLIEKLLSEVDAIKLQGAGDSSTRTVNERILLVYEGSVNFLETNILNEVKELKEQYETNSTKMNQLSQERQVITEEIQSLNKKNKEIQTKISNLILDNQL